MTVHSNAEEEEMERARERLEGVLLDITARADGYST